jgi:hypothetical protein
MEQHKYNTTLKPSMQTMFSYFNKKACRNGWVFQQQNTIGPAKWNTTSAYLSFNPYQCQNALIHVPQSSMGKPRDQVFTNNMGDHVTLSSGWYYHVNNTQLTDDF